MQQITIDGVIYNLTQVEVKKTKTITKEQRFAELISGIDINRPVIDFEKYPDSIFWFKNEDCLFKYDLKSGYFWCKYSTVWSVFEQEFSMSYNDIQSFIKIQVEEYFKLKGITPVE